MEDKKSKKAVVKKPRKSRAKKDAVVDKDSNTNVKELRTDVELGRQAAVTKIRNLRLHIDGINQYSKVKTLSAYTREDSLFKAKCWLGKLLAELGTDSPYKDESKIKTIKDIPATAEDVKTKSNFNKKFFDFGNLSTLDAVLMLRSSTADAIIDLDSIDMPVGSLKNPYKASVAKAQTYIHLCEAKFELGFILSQIKK